MTGDVILLDGNSLTIEPGTYVEFQGHYFLNIYGDLQANGVEVIRSYSLPKILQQAGGIYFEANSDITTRNTFITDDLSTGRIVHFQDNIINDRIEFFRGGLPSGIYLFELRGPQIYRGKIVIK